MTHEELKQIFQEEDVLYSRVNGFEFRHSGTDYAILEGRIPLMLARKIHEGIDNSKLQICVHGSTINDTADEWASNVELKNILFELYENWKRQGNFSLEDVYENTKSEYIKKLKEKNRINDVYILYYHIHTKEGVKHVIKCIREARYVNTGLYN